MDRYVGTVVRGIRTPIIKEGDNLCDIVVDSLLKAKESEGFEFKDKDIVAVTEAVVSIADGNYVSIDEIAEDIRNKFPSGDIGVVFPILSRNRFSMILKSIARGVNKITIQLSYPSDEVGNHLFDDSLLDKYNINPYSDTLTLEEYNKYFGNITHTFTGVNYVKFYKELCEKENCKVDFVFSNNPKTILNYTKDVLACDIHTRSKTKEILKNNGGRTIYGLDDIMCQSINGSRYNLKYGLLGSNKSTEERLKLFPTSGEKLVHDIQNKLKEITGKKIEVMVYGDGAFKDPVGRIWELADPVVSPAYTEGLEGTPNEIKLKYISDNKYDNLRGKELEDAIKEEIKHKDNDLKGKNTSLGTTPRKLTDLIGSLCDLTSGSGDKGTPVVFIQGYFDNYAS